MGLIYCGMDEAGYGPMLGPLCVGFAAFRLADWTPTDGAPDLWKVLGKAVCRETREAKASGRIAVADSKKLKGSNQLKTRHPLGHLERGVLAFGGLVDGTAGSDGTGGSGGAGDAGIEGGAEIDTDAALFAALGVRLEDRAWYGGDDVALPLEGGAGALRIARNRLALACEGAGVEALALACIAVGESEFNDVVTRAGSKGEVTGRCVVRFIRRAVERWGRSADDVRIVCDRQGGRTSYAPMVEAAVGGSGTVEILEESARCSRYRVMVPPSEPLAQARDAASEREGRGTEDAEASPHPGPHPGPLPRGEGGETIVQFLPEAEDAHLPVALASMAAKLVRELAMMRFNRYWCGRVPELKPTAGYVQDARRWLEDVEGVVAEDERVAMVRMA